MLSFDADDVRTWAMSLAFDVDASATDSADGMPYITSIVFPATPPAGQTVNGAGVGTYTLLRAYVYLSPAAENAVGEWQVLAAGPVVLDSGQITQADVESEGVFLYQAPTGERVYMVDIPVSATLAAATTYTITWDTVSGTGALSTYPLSTTDNAGTTHGNPATYGGTTLDFGGSDALDWPATLSTQPAAPSGFEAYPLARTITPTGPEMGCGYQTIEDVQLQWNPTDMGADFGYYQIDRSTDGGTTWQTIRHLTDEDVDRSTDNTMPFNTTTLYRMRVVRAGDLIPSAWSFEEAATPTVDGCPVVLSTELAAALTQVYPRGPVITWGWPSYDQQTITSPAGADYFTAVVPSEWRGSTWAPQVSVWSPGFASNPSDPPAPGEAAFDPLNDLLRTPAPYVCVRDETGRVWFANVTAAEGSRSEPFHAYTAELAVAEVTATPAVLDQQATILGIASAWWDARAGLLPTGDLEDLSGNGNDLIAGAFNHPRDLIDPDDGFPSPRYFSAKTDEADPAPSLMSTPNTASLQVAASIDLRALACASGDPTGGVSTPQTVIIRKVVSGTSNLDTNYSLNFTTAAAAGGAGLVRLTWRDSATVDHSVDVTPFDPADVLDIFEPNEVRCGLVADNGSGGHDVYAFIRDETSTGGVLYQITADGKRWRLIGVENGVGTTDIEVDTGQLTFMIGKGWGYYGQVYDGIDGTLVADLDIASDAEAGDLTVVDGAGLTWTATGFSAILSNDRAGLALTDDTEWTAPDAPGLDIGTGDGSAAVAFQPFDISTPGSFYLSKYDGTFGVNATGWAILESSGAGGVGGAVSDGGTLGLALSNTGYTLADHVVAFTIERTAQDLLAYLDGAAHASDSDISNAPDLSNAGDADVSTGGGFVFYAAAIWDDNALTASQQATLNTEMTAAALPAASDPFIWVP